MDILFTSVGRRSYLVKYFKKALGSNGKVHVANSSPISPAFLIADYSVVTPLIYDNNYISFLLEYCLKHKIKAIISLFDIDLPILSKNRELFKKNGINVIVSDYDKIAICNDKWKTFCFLKKKGFNVPKTYISLNDVYDALTKNIISFPVMIKPRWGMGSIAVFEAENKEELNVFYSKVKRDIQKTYLKYESSIDLENSILIQEKLSGQEYGLDVINDLECNYINTICKIKYSMRSGETDCAITVNDMNLKKLGSNLSSVMKHRANLDVDVFKVDEKYFILEMNARFGGGYPFSHLAGVNLPAAIVKWLNNEPTNNIELLTERINIIGQKDIEIVRLKKEMETYLKITSDKEVIVSLITEFEKKMEPTLSERNVNINDYAKKLFLNGITIVCYNNLKPVGILAGYFNDYINKKAYISLLVVDYNYRGNNVGEKLISKAEEIALHNDLIEITLEVRKNNYNAISFYRKNGYEVYDEASITSLYMKKLLKGELNCKVTK